MIDPWILVALPGDFATTQLVEIADRLLSVVDREPTWSSMEELFPSPTLIRSKIDEGNIRRAIVMAHGSLEGLSPTRDGTLWCDHHQFVAMFGGLEVYVLACDTMKGTPSFGINCVAACVRVFVGHCAEIQARPHPVFDHEEIREHLWGSYAETLRRFLHGDRDTGVLSEAAKDYWAEKLPPFDFDPNKLDPEVGDPTTAVGMQLKRFRKSLCLEFK